MTTQLVPDRLALPPPLELDLVDAGRATGWIADNAVGFRGFGDETEAAHAAWVAHRTVARRLARTHGGRPVPVDIEPLAIQRVDGTEMILASGRPIASLVRPGPDSRSGVDSFGFELLIPAAVTELEARALAYLVYRTLRRSGIRWALWRPDTLRVVEASTEQRNADTATDASETVNGEQPYRAAWEPLAVPTSRASTDLTTVLVVLPIAAVTVLAVGVAPLVTIPAAVLLAAVMLLRSRRLR
jgi:hypothetical protein